MDTFNNHTKQDLNTNYIPLNSTLHKQTIDLNSLFLCSTFNKCNMFMGCDTIFSI